MILQVLSIRLRMPRSVKLLPEEIPGNNKESLLRREFRVYQAVTVLSLWKTGQRGNGFDTHQNLIENNQIYREVYESQTGGGSGDFDEEGKE